MSHEDADATATGTGGRSLCRSWYVYMVCCADASLYTGITRHPARRLEEHNSGAAAARYTRARRPVGLVYCEVRDSRSAAAQREYALKRLSRAAKISLVLGSLEASARLSAPAELCRRSLRRLRQARGRQPRRD